MFGRILIPFCFLAMISGMPVGRKIPPKKTEHTSTVNLPNIELPESTKNKTKYELLGGGYEGDMMFPKGFNPSTASEDKGVAIVGPRQWPNNIIPYDMSAITSPYHRGIIVQAMKTLMYAVGTPIPGETTRKMCVQFRPRQREDRKFFSIGYGPGCSATVGYWADTPSWMALNNPGCFYTGVIQHELMHILGFYHEQSRPDRDSYISVNYNNIERGQVHNFDRFVWGRTVLNQNTRYDLESIMHYASNAFSVNGRPTITPRRSSVVLGQREQLSLTDITEIRAYYGC